MAASIEKVTLFYGNMRFGVFVDEHEKCNVENDNWNFTKTNEKMQVILNHLSKISLGRSPEFERKPLVKYDENNRIEYDKSNSEFDQDNSENVRKLNSDKMNVYDNEIISHPKKSILKQTPRADSRKLERKSDLNSKIMKLDRKAKSEEDTEIDEDNLENMNRLEDFPSEMYMSGDILLINSDDTHEIRHEINKMRQISYFTMTKLLCSMLNTSKHSVVYFGLNSNCTIKGISATREERDAFRCGIDNIMTTKIEPRLLQTNFKIKFIPVFKIQDFDHFNIEDLKYIMEIHLYPIPNTLYKRVEGDCYLRKNGESICATMNDIRLLVGFREEERFLKQINVLEKAIETFEMLM